MPIYGKILLSVQDVKTYSGTRRKYTPKSRIGELKKSSPEEDSSGRLFRKNHPAQVGKRGEPGNPAAIRGYFKLCCLCLKESPFFQMGECQLRKY